MQDNARHHIQREIIGRLTGGARRFSALKPDGMESNIFMYHLKALMRAGLVAKSDITYALTSSGITYVDRLSAATNTLRLQPKLIAILVVRSHDGRLAVLERHAEPYVGSYMLPSGKMHFGETLPDHAARELREKTGLQVQLQYDRLASIAISRDATLLTQVVAAIWTATVPQDALLQCTDERFTARWIQPGETLPYMPGTEELVAALKGNDPLINLDVRVVNA
jgi:ADP-ribose pyrophosphatase YjhB (NUDIX family)